MCPYQIQLNQELKPRDWTTKNLSKWVLEEKEVEADFLMTFFFSGEAFFLMPGYVS